RYTPVTKRSEKPNAVAYLLKTYPDLADVQIAKLVGSTKPTVDAIRNKTHASSSTIKPTDPVSLGLCTKDELEKAVRRAERRIIREAKAAGKPIDKISAAAEAMTAEETPAGDGPSGNDIAVSG